MLPAAAHQALPRRSAAARRTVVPGPAIAAAIAPLAADVELLALLEVDAAARHTRRASSPGTRHEGFGSALTAGDGGYGVGQVTQALGALGRASRSG